MDAAPGRGAGVRTAAAGGRHGPALGHGTRKWLPRRIRPGIDAALARQVLAAGRTLGFDRPLLWINDVAFAPVITATGWPSVYDVTDDWLLADGVPRWLARERANDALALREADEVVVCSLTLPESRGKVRPVHLVTNGVDVEHLRAPTVRPSDLPSGRIVLYQGTLVAGRLDLPLCAGLARGLRGRATLVLLGPNSLTRDAEADLVDAGAVVLGGRPYADMPAYLQHADVLVVPHQVNPFVEPLDPSRPGSSRRWPSGGLHALAGFRAWPRRWRWPTGTIRRGGGPGARPVRPLPPGPGALAVRRRTWAAQAEQRSSPRTVCAAGRPPARPRRIPRGRTVSATHLQAGRAPCRRGRARQVDHLLAGRHPRRCDRGVGAVGSSAWTVWCSRSVLVGRPAGAGGELLTVGRVEASDDHRRRACGGGHEP